MRKKRGIRPNRTKLTGVEHDRTCTVCTSSIFAELFCLPKFINCNRIDRNECRRVTPLRVSIPLMLKTGNNIPLLP